MTGPIVPLMVGAAIGLVGAIVLDNAFLTEKPVERSLRGVALAPSFSVAATGASFGLVGQF